MPRSGRIAWKVRSRPSTAEPPAELPSTRKSSADSGSWIWQSASLPGSEAESSAPFRRVRSRAWRAALRARAASIAFWTIFFASWRILLEELGQPRVHRPLHHAPHPRVAELGLRLALELRLAQLHGDDRGETLAHVLAFEVVLLLLEQVLRARVVVQRLRERGAEAGEVRPALRGVDVVREGEDRLHVEAVPLHRDLDGALLFLALEVDDVLVDRVLRRVDVRDEVLDAAVVLELDPLAAGALVGEDDVHALGEERGLAQALGEDLGVPLDPVREDLRIREEADDGACVLSDPDLLELGLGLPTRELLAIDLAVEMDFGDQPFGERVHDRDADAVQAARYLVPVAAELSAGVELGQDDRQRRQPLLLHHLDGDPAAVIRDRHGVVRMDDDLGVVVVPTQGFIDSIVDHLEHEMVEPARTGRADVHPRPEPDRLEAFEDGDVFCGVGRFGHAGVTKKALQIPRFRAELSLSERAVGRGSCEACRSRSGDELPQLRIVHLCSNFSRSGPVGRGWGERNSSLFPDALCTRFRERTGRETQPPRLGLAERVREARRDLRLELRELEGPRRGADRNVQCPVPPQPCRPRVRGDRVADDRRPRSHDLGHPTGGPEAGELATDVAADSLHYAAFAIPGDTSINWSGGVGSASADVAVTRL